jgi:hypothetical protein
MAGKVVLTVDVTEEERERIEALARRRGYTALGDYVRALIAFDARLHSEESVLEGDPDQAYFWTEHWQAGERETDEDIARGRVETFDTMNDLIADLTDDE